jgi:hypothetical protein
LYALLLLVFIAPFLGLVFASSLLYYAAATTVILGILDLGEIGGRFGDAGRANGAFVDGIDRPEVVPDGELRGIRDGYDDLSRGRVLALFGDAHGILNPPSRLRKGVGFWRNLRTRWRKPQKKWRKLRTQSVGEPPLDPRWPFETLPEGLLHALRLHATTRRNRGCRRPSGSVAG